MSELRPNAKPALQQSLSQRLRKHIEAQLLSLGPTPRAPEPRPYNRAPGMRLSDGLACTVCLPLYMQVHDYATTHNMPVAKVIRTAVMWFLDAPFTRPVNIGPNTKYLPRKATLTFSISPKTYPDLRSRLDTYAAENRRAVAAVVRRAIYEYTRNKEEPENIDVMHDAWADADLPR